MLRRLCLRDDLQSLVQYLILFFGPSAFSFGDRACTVEKRFSLCAVPSPPVFTNVLQQNLDYSSGKLVSTNWSSSVPYKNMSDSSELD